MFTVSLPCIVICGGAALLGGFIDAIAGGGGLLTIPAMLLSGVPPYVTLGTNQISTFLGTATSLWKFSVNRLVCWRMVAYGFGFSIVGSWFGCFTAMSLAPETLAKIIITLLPITIIGILLPQKRKHDASSEITTLRLKLFLPILCFIMGWYGGFLGAGTGTFLILGLFWCVRLPLLGASATAKAFNLASNISATLYFIWEGMVSWKLGIIMATCFIVGNWAGTGFAIYTGSKSVRIFLLISFALLLISLIWRFIVIPE